MLCRAPNHAADARLFARFRSFGPQQWLSLWLLQTGGFVENGRDHLRSDQAAAAVVVGLQAKQAV